MDTAPQRRLDRAIFNRPTLSVARHLLGKFIVRRDRGRQLAAMITEVEAYRGPRDRASHTFGGRRTARVEPLYAEGGTAYVHLVYGMHWLLNFSTAGAGNPEGVLIRGVLTAGSAQRTLVSGPGRVTSYLCVDRRLDRIDATQSMRMWIEDRDVRVPVRRVMTGPRVGIDYAGAYWAARPWRFWIDLPDALTSLNQAGKAGRHGPTSTSDGG